MAYCITNSQGFPPTVITVIARETPWERCNINTIRKQVNSIKSVSLQCDMPQDLPLPPANCAMRLFTRLALGTLCARTLPL